MNWYKSKPTVIKVAAEGFSTSYVYDAFALSLIDVNALDQSESFEIQEHFNEIKNIVSNEFINLLKEQIAKYLNRGRIDQKQVSVLSNYKNATPAQMAEMFDRYTFRSDMQRTNVQWGDIARATDALIRTNNPQAIAKCLTYQKGLFNLIHNAGTPVIDKFANGHSLLAAFEECQHGNPSLVISKTSRNVKRIFLNHTRKQGF